MYYTTGILKNILKDKDLYRKGMSVDQMIDMLESYKTTLTYRVKNSNVDSSYFNVYADKKKVHRIEIIIWRNIP